MGRQTPLGEALTAAFREEVLPVVAPLGFRPSRPDHVRPGTVLAGAAAELDGARARLMVWFPPPGGGGFPPGKTALLSLRLDRAEIGPDGQERRSLEIELPSPWPDPDIPRQQSLGRSLRKLLPGQSGEQLRAALAVLAGGLVANADLLAAAFPSLAPAVAARRNSSLWTEAWARADELYRSRHQRGPVDDRAVEAKVLFGGDALVMVEADGRRVTLRFDGAGHVDKSQPVFLRAWVENPAGDPVPTVLAQGEREWRFDALGRGVDE